MKYYNVVFSSMLLLGIAADLKGQSRSCDLGIEGGPGLSIIYAKTGMYSDSRFSIGGFSGVFFQDNFNQIFALKTGINYERKSTQVQYSSDQLPQGGKLYYNFDYLSIPVLFKVSAGHKVQFFANTGPCFSYMLDQSIDYKPQNGKPYKVGSELISYKTFDLGLIFGLGLLIPVHNRFLISFELRDNLGLLNIRYSDARMDPFGNYYTDVVQQFKAYPNSTTLLVGFAYRFTNLK
jgi:hypothetical protein